MTDWYNVIQLDPVLVCAVLPQPATREFPSLGQ